MKILNNRILLIQKKALPYVSVGIILLCLIAITIYQTKTPAPTNIYTKRVQQEYMKDLIVTHFTETGSIKDQIYANYWAYIPTIGNSALHHPKMHLTKPNGSKWIIQAEYGKAWHTTLDSSISRLDLDKNVLIERLKTNEFVPIIMKTEQVSYFRDTDFVETEQYVEMEKPGFSVSGIGLKGHLNTDTFQLLNDVKTNYETAS